MNTRKLLDDIEHKICCHELTKEQVFTKMKCIIQTLERSHNSDYEGGKLSKLPSLYIVKKSLQSQINAELINNDQIYAVYKVIEKLGNFS